MISVMCAKRRFRVEVFTKFVDILLDVNVNWKNNVQKAVDISCYQSLNMYLS